MMLSCSAGVSVEASPRGFADHDRAHAGFDLALAKLCERRQIEPIVFIERRGNVGYVARQPGGGF